MIGIELAFSWKTKLNIEDCEAFPLGERKELRCFSKVHEIQAIKLGH